MDRLIIPDGEDTIELALREEKETIFERIAGEYGEKKQEINWIRPEQVWSATEERLSLLASLSAKGAVFHCNQTKPIVGEMSPGCRLCTEGKWSCLFVSDACNGHCFYCPTEQTAQDPPMTSTLPFDKPRQYGRYVEFFGFEGVSFSGGEPFLSFNNTLRYLEAVRKNTNHSIYFWLYSNGIAADKEKLKQLRDLGLNEIRFNIGAVDYKLDAPAKAIGIIPNVTVEIPAIPEDIERMKTTMLRMAEIGVKYLNLHQLRLTPYNFPHLIKRGYSFLHGEKITVLESELTALKLAEWAAEKSLPLSVNYCSFAYKSRYQQAAARKRAAAYLIKENEIITPAAYIRTLTESPEQLTVTYSECRTVSRISYHYPFHSEKLDDGKTIFFERRPVMGPIVLKGDDIEAFSKRFIERRSGMNPELGRADSIGRRIADFEQIKSGLQEYW